MESAPPPPAVDSLSGTPPMPAASSSPSPPRLKSSSPSPPGPPLPTSLPFLMNGGMASKALKSPVVISPSPTSASLGLMGTEAALHPHGGLLMTANPLPQMQARTHGPTASAPGKALRIRCVVENGAKMAAANDSSSSKPPSASLLPRAAVCNRADRETVVAVPGSAMFSELVAISLLQMGFTAADVMGSKGTLHLKHWKPLSFDAISENPDATIDQILGDIATSVTLRIRLCSKPKAMAVEDMKEKLLRFLLDHSRGVLSSLGCPIEQSFLSSICKGTFHHQIPDDIRDSFNRWISLQSSDSTRPSSATGLPDSGRSQFLARRASFDPEHDIPRLQKWFSLNQHPSHEQMEAYLKELNSMEGRYNRPLVLANVQYWFKNARAALRRSAGQSRGMEDRESQAHSPVSSQDDEEEDSRPCSSPASEDVPVLPNRNAVYVVQPLAPEEEDKIEIVDINEECKQRERVQHHEGDENHNKCLSLQVPSQQNHEHHQQEQATDLSLPRRHSGDSGLHTSHESLRMRLSSSSCSSASPTDGNTHAGSGGPNRANANPVRLPMKREREEPEEEEGRERELGRVHDERYQSSNSSNTPSPRLLVRPDGKSPALGQAPHLAPHFNPHALQLAAFNMSHALNMPYLHPSLYGVDAAQLASMAAAGGPPYKEDMEGSPSSALDADRKKRSRVFIDPLTEIPKLENWFIEDTHPSSYMIEKYTEELNRSTYRQRFPRLEPKNVQLWFKNHRAKVKRQRLEVS